jgi:hypothetical protein
LIGGATVDNSPGASAILFAAAVVPALAFLFILSQERGISVAPALSRRKRHYDHDFREKRCNDPDQCVHG